MASLSEQLAAKARALKAPAESDADILAATRKADEVGEPDASERLARPRKNEQGGSRNREKRGGYLPDIHRALPQSLDAEKGVLCSALLSPGNVMPIVAEMLTDRHFHHPAHQIIYREMLDIHEHTDKPLDFITLTQVLKDKGELDKAGGAASVSELFTFVPTASNADFYIDIVREKYLLRLLIDKCMRFGSAAYEHEGDVKVLLDDAEEEFRNLGEEPAGADGTETYDFGRLAGFDVRGDPSALLGQNRWLCRGGSCLWVGQSGLGKSALMMQAAITWALGRSLWGVAPVRTQQLKSLFIQAENDEGDMAEMSQGVMAAYPLPPGWSREQLIAHLNRHIVFHRDVKHSGRDFARAAKRLIRKHKPDLVWVDPLLSFAGGDISKQEVASDFLRAMLNPISIEHGIVWMLLHHTGKPPTDAKAKAAWTDEDFSYEAFGSSELVNWARAVNILQPIGDGRFRLRFGKRGRRAGAMKFDTGTAEDNPPQYTNSIFLRHAEKGIFWEQIDEPSDEELAEAKRKRLGGRAASGQYQAEFAVEQVIDVLKRNPQGVKPSHVKVQCYEGHGMKERTFWSLWKKAKTDPMVSEKNGLFFYLTS